MNLVGDLALPGVACVHTGYRKLSMMLTAQWFVSAYQWYWCCTSMWMCVVWRVDFIFTVVKLCLDCCKKRITGQCRLIEIITINVSVILRTLYKYWLVPRSTLKNYAPKLCNVARGPKAPIAQLRSVIFRFWSRLTVNICFVISRKTGKNSRIPHSASPAYSNS